MTDSKRIEALEQEVALLRRQLLEVMSVIQHVGGGARAFDNAVLAILRCGASPVLLKQVEEHLLRAEAGIVSAAEDESHLIGFQESQEVILLAASPPPAS